MYVTSISKQRRPIAESERLILIRGFRLEEGAKSGWSIYAGSDSTCVHCSA